jgi:hypothetical protein
VINVGASLLLSIGVISLQLDLDLLSLLFKRDLSLIGSVSVEGKVLTLLLVSPLFFGSLELLSDLLNGDGCRIVGSFQSLLDLWVLIVASLDVKVDSESNGTVSMFLFFQKVDRH